MKLTVSDAAKEQLAPYQGKSIRIFVEGVGWGGPRFGMALDEAKENDIVIEEAGLKFVFDERMDKEVPEISLDYGSSPSGQGFFIRTANPSGCDSGCDSGCC